MTNTMSTRVAILGSGPAGLTAAIYAARAGLSPIVIQGIQPGGQLTTTTDVENYPGFPDGIMGPEMMLLFRKQAERFGTEILLGNVVQVDFSGWPFKIITEEQTIESKTIIIATGMPTQSAIMIHMSVSLCTHSGNSGRSSKF